MSATVKDYAVSCTHTTDSAKALRQQRMRLSGTPLSTCRPRVFEIILLAQVRAKKRLLRSCLAIRWFSELQSLDRGICGEGVLADLVKASGLY